jgi:chemotaxis signal transduction protein
MPTDDQDRGAHNDQAGPAKRTLFILRAGASLFAVFAEEVEASAPDLTPTPLPFAPPAVLGVVSLRGRIRTVIDPLRLADSAPGDNSPDDDSLSSDSPKGDATGDGPSVVRQTQPRLFVALAGDEQLALACDAVEGEFDIAEFDIASPRASPDAAARSALRGTFERAGERVALLDPSHLFDAVTRGTERRRRRS